MSPRKYGIPLNVGTYPADQYTKTFTPWVSTNRIMFERWFWYDEQPQNHPKGLFSTPKKLEKNAVVFAGLWLRTAKVHQNSQEVAETIKTIEPGNVGKKEKGLQSCFLKPC